MVTLNICQHCGSILPQEQLLYGPIRNAIVQYIIKHPDCAMEQIVNHVYKDDPDGGPISNSVSVLLCKIKKELPAKGLKLSRTGMRYATYRIEKVSPE